MKRTLIFLFSLLMYQSVFSQIYRDSWSVGASLNSVRYTSEVRAEALDFGGNIYIQKDFNETHALRGILSYGHLTSVSPSLSTDNFSLGLDYILKFAQVSPIYPYLGAGFSLVYFDVSGSPVGLDGSKFGELSANIFFGAIFDIIGDDLKLKGEFSQHTLSTDEFDGVYGTEGGLFGGSVDSYIEFGIGIHYYFERGKVIEQEKPSGLAGVDYSKIEEINKKYAPKPDKAPVETLQKKVDALNKKLEELNQKLQKPEQSKFEKGEIKQFKTLYFKINTAELKFESLHDMVRLAMALLHDNSIVVELDGYTDNIGTDDFNMALSKKRAEFVKNYLLSQGVDNSRIRIKYFGSKNPIASNNDESGRALNRRVEIKILK